MNIRVRHIILLVALFWAALTNVSGQTISSPEVFYSSPRKYVIAGVEIVGENVNYDDFEKRYIIQNLGLSVGSVVKIPGDDITRAIRRLYNQKSFSGATILLSKVVNDSAYLTIQLEPAHQLSEVNFWGLKKSEETKIRETLGIEKGMQMNDFMIETIRRKVTESLEAKGYYNVDLRIVQRDDPDNKNFEIIDVYAERKNKIKIKEIEIVGNSGVKESVLKRSMKSTREKSLLNFFKSSKYVEETYEEEKYDLLDKYNERGYRDAMIVSDSVIPLSDKRVKIVINVDEGNRYYFNNLIWIGNTVYDSEMLNEYIGISKGDVYNKKLFNDQLKDEEESLLNAFYTNQGYLFANVYPTERIVGKDSIDIEIRVVEGAQATINRVDITGNDKTHEHVIRRELYVYPGELYSREDIMRSIHQLANLGHFDPEVLGEKLTIVPNQENGTVDIGFGLKEKGNDRVEISGGWGAGMIIASVGLTFTNFSMRNIFNFKTYRPLPQGDGQTFSLNAQTNGKFYSNFSVSFVEPWLGGKKPNSLSVSAFYSHQSGYSSNYYRRSYYVNSGGQSAADYDDSQHMNIWGLSVGLGRRLKWPDDYFTMYNGLSYQHYDLKNWPYYVFENGTSNNLAITTTIRRSSIDNPNYTRSGSDFSLSLSFTPPYSLFNGKNYANKNMTSEERYRWVEYHKWKFNGKVFVPLDKQNKTVLYMNAQYGYLGHYNKDHRSPFEGYEMGGDGMSGYSLYGREYIGLRGYANGSLTNAGSSFIATASDAAVYSKFTMEVRYPVSLKDAATIYVLSFLEAGNSWARIKDFEPFNLYRSAGLGVRVFLPMLGMLGIDWGYGFDKVPGRSDASGSQFHFVLGQEF
ncbi:MAG: outer membrane protein assembly factor BamA [Marinifilaceae bacterium]|nr:outer membrane protein assembly factor BamA [Marinifilaceae bacterium]